MSEIFYAHCNSCSRQTKHELLYGETVSWAAEDGSISGGTHHRFLRCRGCDDFCYQRVSYWDDDRDAIFTQYPAATARRKPEWLDFDFWLEATEISDLLDEVYAAYQSSGLRLCALGIRALVEAIMIEQVKDEGSLGENINKFFEMGFVAPKSQEMFKSKLIEVGNAAMHRGYNPTIDDIKFLLDITEGFVESIYIHPKKAKEVGDRIPPRVKRAPSKPE